MNDVIDWPIIRAEYEAGTTLAELARRYAVSRQAIGKHRDREGWEQSKAITEVLSPEKLGQDTPDTRAEILRYIEGGTSQELAIAAVGVTQIQFEMWAQEDEDFARAVEVAEARGIAERIVRVTEAGRRGYVKADQWYLERHRKTRETFGGQHQAGGQTIQVVVQIERDTRPEFSGNTIEHGSGGTVIDYPVKTPATEMPE